METGHPRRLDGGNPLSPPGLWRIVRLEFDVTVRRQHLLGNREIQLTSNNRLPYTIPRRHTFRCFFNAGCFAEPSVGLGLATSEARAPEFPIEPSHWQAENQKLLEDAIPRDAESNSRSQIATRTNTSATGFQRTFLSGVRGLVGIEFKFYHRDSVSLCDLLRGWPIISANLNIWKFGRSAISGSKVWIFAGFDSRDFNYFDVVTIDNANI